MPDTVPAMLAVMIADDQDHSQRSDNFLEPGRNNVTDSISSRCSWRSNVCFPSISSSSTMNSVFIMTRFSFLLNRSAFDMGRGAEREWSHGQRCTGKVLEGERLEHA